MASTLAVVVVVVVVCVILLLGFALSRKGDVRATLRARDVDFSIEAKDRRKRR